MSGVHGMVRSLKPGRSSFDLSYAKILTCDMGQLIPIMCDEVVPGDTFKLGAEIVVRFQPMVAPTVHEINVYTHYFFVPYRQIDEDFVEFITGGVDGETAAVLPRWNPTNTAIGSLWDYLGMPTGVNPTGALPLDYPRRAYNRVYNEYYRDETLIAEVPETNEAILNRCWEKDYFASALPWQQRGTAPALPISGNAPAIFDFDGSTIAGKIASAAVTGPDPTAPASINIRRFGILANAAESTPQFLPNPGAVAVPDALERLVLTPGLGQYLSENNLVDLTELTTFDVSDLRQAFQIQKWMERNARCGVRYTEYLEGHYGEAPRDDTLQRPVYIGGSKSPVIVSEVLQTSSTDGTSPQGNLAGHGLVADAQKIGAYHAKEFGLIIGIMSIMPRTVYTQGIDRQWLRRSRYDFYAPEFANMSEQAIERAEIYANGVEADNRTVFGFQGRYDEMRVKKSMVCGLMRTDFNYWHMAREFTAAPELNEAFVKCVPTKRIFAVPTEPGLVVHVGNKITAIRPLPVKSEPGYIDH